MDREEREAALRELYAQVPTMADCKGLCADSCHSPFDVTHHEAARARRVSGRRLVPGSGHRACSMLTPDGRCGIYDDRPMVCRLFGATKGMACQYGCRPTRWLTEAQAVWLIVRSFEVGGIEGDILDADTMRDLAQANPGMFAAIRGMLR